MMSRKLRIPKNPSPSLAGKLPQASATTLKETTGNALRTEAAKDGLKLRLSCYTGFSRGRR
jgi:hypothetical protein